jgi:hypothetical protein
MVKAKDLSDSVDGKYSKEDAKEEADRAKKTSIKVVSILMLWSIGPVRDRILILNHTSKLSDTSFVS